MKTYKDYQKWNIGSSDIASLLLLGCNENGAEPMLLTFGSDGDYSAYIIPDNVDIGEHYKKVAEYTDWLKIYDDSSLVVDIKAKHISVYRAGDFGCVIQVTEPITKNFWFIEDEEK